MSRNPHGQHGFTLLELMITITVVAVLMAIAVPSFRDVIRRNQVSSASNELLAGLSYARTEAITRGQLVSVCPSSNGSSCAGGDAYESGWLVYTYPAGAAAPNEAYDAGSMILLRATTTRPSVSIQSKDATNSVITFGQQGQLRPATALTFVTCSRTSATGTGESTNAVRGVELTINGSGSVVSKTLSGGSACTP